MPPYLVAFLAALAIDTLPAFAPPSWTALVYCQIHYGLNVWLVTLVGVAGSACGRLILSSYIHHVARHVLSEHEQANIEYLGTCLGRSVSADLFFVFLYCLTPLPAAPLFLAAGIADLRRSLVLPPFVAGKLISIGLIVAAGKASAGSLTDLFHGKVSPQALLMSAAGLAVVGALLFIDWHALLHDKRFRLDFDVLRSKPRLSSSRPEGRAAS